MTKSFNMSDWRRKYVLMAENNIQQPPYDPEKHKTLMKGAIDYELSGDNIIAYLPFEEEPEEAVEYIFPKAKLESWTGEDIETNDDLQNLDYSEVVRFFHDKQYGPFAEAKEEKPSSEMMKEIAEEKEVDATKVSKAVSMIKKAVSKYAEDMDSETAAAFHKELHNHFNKK